MHTALFGYYKIPGEWWHFYLKDGEQFELLDIDFKKLKR